MLEGRPVPQDLLGVLLTAADETGQTLNDEELWEDVHDVMGAGRGAHVHRLHDSTRHGPLLHLQAMP